MPAEGNGCDAFLSVTLVTKRASVESQLSFSTLGTSLRRAWRVLLHVTVDAGARARACVRWRQVHKLALRPLVRRGEGKRCAWPVDFDRRVFAANECLGLGSTYVYVFH